MTVFPPPLRSDKRQEQGQPERLETLLRGQGKYDGARNLPRYESVALPLSDTGAATTCQTMLEGGGGEGGGGHGDRRAGQGHQHRRALAHAARKLERPAVQFDVAPRERQPDAGPFVGAVEAAVHLVERRKDLLLLLRRDPDARILDADADRVGAAVELHLNAAMLVVELDGVVQQILQRRQHAAAIHLQVERGIGRLGEEGDRPRGGAGRERGDRIPHQVLGDDRLPMQLDLRPVHQIDQLLQQPMQPLIGPVQHPDRLLLVVGELAERAVGEQVDPFAHEAQRRIDLVREGGEELALQVVQLAQSPVQLLQLEHAFAGGAELPAHGDALLAAVEDRLDLGDVERLGDEVAGAFPHGGHGALNGGVGGDHDDVQEGVQMLELPEQLHPVELRHLDVGDHDIGGLVPKLVERLEAVAGQAHGAAAGGEDLPEQLADLWLVVDHKDVQQRWHRLQQGKWRRDPDLHWGREAFQASALLPELSRLRRIIQAARCTLQAALQPSAE